MKVGDAADQVAALPFRVNASELQILLVTSRSSHRWIVPKGWPIPGLQPHEAAAQEAFEEAGVVGRAIAASVGQFQSQKGGRVGRPIETRITVYPLEVGAERARWPEMRERERRWFSVEDAARSVQNDGLKRIILGFRNGLPGEAREPEITH